MPDTPLYRVLIVGAGSIGERHARCFLETRRAAVSICESNAATRQRVADRYELQAAFADLPAAVDHEFDAAVIATPADTHLEIARQLVERGLHVLIEKPLGTSLEGLAPLRQAVDRQGVVAAVAYVLLAHPILADMQQAITSGRFGRPLQLVASSGQHFPSYRPAYREIYYTDHARGGGAIQDALTHLLNAAEWLVGPVDRLVADAEHLQLEGVTVEDTVHVVARHGSLLACFTLNQFQAPNELAITVACTEATCRFELHRHRWSWLTAPGGLWNTVQFPEIARDESFVRQAHAFLDAVAGKQGPLCSLDEGAQTLAVNLAALESARSDEKFVSLP